MAKEITELTELLAADVADGDELPIYDVSAGSGNAKKIKRGSLLNGVARDGGDHNFGTSEITDLTTQNAQIGFTAGATLTKVLHSSASPTFGSISADAGETQTVTLTGATTSDQLTWAFTEAVPDGIIPQAWISAADTVSIRLYNTTGSPIAGASYGMRLTALRFA
jgi:hypothetical protein